MLQIDLVGPPKSTQFKYVLSGICFYKIPIRSPIDKRYADTVA